MTSDHLDLMTRFRRGYAKRDRAQLEQVLDASFEWHQHWFASNAPEPTGLVLVGIDAMCEELEWRAANWNDVRFDGLVERFAPGFVTQTFRISGVDRGKPFETDAVDLYLLTDDEQRITRKDTYWKQPMEPRA